MPGCNMTDDREEPIVGEIITEQRGKVLVVTIANERKRNALSVSMEKPFLEALVEADNNDTVRAIVITGAGNIAFCSGHDLSEVGRPGIKFTKPDPMGHPDRMNKPVIAAVNGHCHAAGLMMALCCDLRIASENAAFGQPGAKLGQLPAGGQIWRIGQAIPRAKALEMMMTADVLSAPEAYRLGMVNVLTPQGGALEAAVELANRIARNSPATVQAIKAGLKIFDREGKEAFDRYEATAIKDLASGPDMAEGMRAFTEKRAPDF